MAVQKGAIMMAFPGSGIQPEIKGALTPTNQATDHPMGVIESHTMQVNRLQDHKNKRVVSSF